MKKYLSFTLALVVMLTALVGCSPNPGSDSTTPSDTTLDWAGAPNVSDLKAFIESIYAKHAPTDLALESTTVNIAEDNELVYFTGLTSAEKLREVAVSEAVMGQAYSLVIAKVADQADAASVAKEMYEKIDSRKWICMEADTKTAAYCGDIVMFFMVTSNFADTVTVESMTEAFEAACGADVTVVA